MAELFLVCLKPPVESDVLLIGGSFEILTGPGPAKFAGHDFHKAAIWLHEVVVDQAGAMHANLKPTTTTGNRHKTSLRMKRLGRQDETEIESLNAMQLTLRWGATQTFGAGVIDGHFFNTQMLLLVLICALMLFPALRLTPGKSSNSNYYASSSGQ